MSRRRKPKGVRSRSRSKPNFGYPGASSAAADPSRKKKKSAVARSLRDGEKSLRQLKAKDTLGRYRSVAHRGSLYLSIKTIAPVDRCWMTFSLDRLRAFIAPADEGSFSAGGRRLRRAQSVVSQTLANLEVQLGVKLFDRSSRSFRSA